MPSLAELVPEPTNLADMFEAAATRARRGIPSPGFLAKNNYWPFAVGNPSLDISQNKDITTLLGDYGGWEGQRGPGEDVGPVSQNVEDRRGEAPYTPGSLDKLREIAGGYLAYPGRRYGPYDADIDASVKRAEAAYAITPALRALGNKEDWFKEIERQQLGAAGPPVPENVMREYKRLTGEANAEPR